MLCLYYQFIRIISSPLYTWGMRCTEKLISFLRTDRQQVVELVGKMCVPDSHSNLRRKFSKAAWKRREKLQVDVSIHAIWVKGRWATSQKKRKVQSLPPTHAWAGDRTYNLDMCPEWKSIPQQFGIRVKAPNNWATGARARIFIVTVEGNHCGILRIMKNS